MNDINREKDLEEISNELRKARKRSGLTQAEVAEAAEITVNYYARIERGEELPSLPCLKTLMRILKIRNLKISAE